MMPEITQLEPMTTSEFQAIEAQNRAEVDIQIATAKRYPRKVDQCLAKAEELIKESEEVAASMFFKLPRKGKVIEGPSVRMAEVLNYSWGNTRSGARVIGQTEKDVTIQASFIDLERNIGVIKEVRRRITDRNGDPYNDDMILMTMNAGAAIAWRNAVFSVIPRVYADRMMRHAKQIAIGSVATLVERRGKLVQAFIKLGVMEKDLLWHLDIADVDSIDLEAISYMAGVYEAIRDDELDVDSLMEVSRNGVVREKVSDMVKNAKAAAKPETLGDAAKAAKAKREQPAEAKQPVEAKAKPAPAQPASTRTKQKLEPQPEPEPVVEPQQEAEAAPMPEPEPVPEEPNEDDIPGSDLFE